MPIVGQMPTRGRLPAKATKTPVRSPETSRRPASTTSQRSAERKLRCSSHISNAFLGWDGSDYDASAARTTNSFSPPPIKIFGNWRKVFLASANAQSLMRRVIAPHSHAHVLRKKPIFPQNEWKKVVHGDCVVTPWCWFNRTFKSQEDKGQYRLERWLKRCQRESNFQPKVDDCIIKSQGQIEPG